MAAIGFAVLVLAGFGLHPTGFFHGDEVLARDGERWLALETTPVGARLVSTRVRLDREVDEMLDGPGEATGRNVVAIASPRADVLMRGPGLESGPVEQGEIIVADPLADGMSAAFRFRGIDYRLAPACPAALPTAGTPQACTMTLTAPGIEVALFDIARWRNDEGEVGYGDAAYPRLLHVADFDRDGQVDLILDTSDHYNASQPTLFLSAPAGKHAPLREVAFHRSTGC